MTHLSSNPANKDRKCGYTRMWTTHTTRYGSARPLRLIIQASLLTVHYWSLARCQSAAVTSCTCALVVGFAQTLPGCSFRYAHTCGTQATDRPCDNPLSVLREADRGQQCRSSSVRTATPRAIATWLATGFEMHVRF